MLNSVGPGSGILWKGTIPFKEKHFTITLFVAFVVVLPLPFTRLVLKEGLSRKGCLLLGLITSVIASIDCYSLSKLLFKQCLVMLLNERCLLLQHCSNLSGGCSCYT